MGKIFNMIISNDLLFYGIIVFLIVGVVLIFVYLHHKKYVSSLEEDIEFQKADDNNFEDNIEEMSTKASYYGEFDKEIEEKISQLDGKMAMAKILEDDQIESFEENNDDDITSNIELENINIEDNNDDKKILTETKDNKEIENSKAPKSELELVLEKMQHDLEEQKDQDAVAIFEQEQEEKSIISYKELLQRKNELTTSEILADERFENESTEIEPTDSLKDSYTKLIDNVNDMMSIDNVKEAFDTENDIPKEDVEPKKKKKFVTTDFISPVFGRRQATLDYPKVPNFKDMMIKKEKTNEYDLETTMNLDPLTDQIKRDDAFLSALKEFRKNLE